MQLRFRPMVQLSRQDQLMARSNYGILQREQKSPPLKDIRIGSSPLRLVQPSPPDLGMARSNYGILQRGQISLHLSIGDRSIQLRFRPMVQPSPPDQAE